MRMKPSRRDVFRTGGMATAGSLLAKAAPAKARPVRSWDDNIYTRIGVRPFINLTATYTINGGTLTLPAVKEAMEEASYFSVNIDELQEGAGQRLAQLFGCESAMVTSGCAAALAAATAACVAGSDPEKMQQLPNLTGLKDEVIMPRQSRNPYDHAIRSVGVKIVEIDTREDFLAALGKHTAMIAVLGTGEERGKVRLEEIIAAAHKMEVPVLVDAAAELPAKPDPYLSRGADLVAYSGGKILRGPQCAGMLLGRRDLIYAARMNASPHHAFGRSMKVGKEETMGMLAAMEYYFSKRNIQEEYRTWESWYRSVSDVITKVPGVTTKILPAKGASPFPVLDIAWDPAKLPVTAGELYDLLINGNPRIMSHAAGDGFSFVLRPAAMVAGQEKLVAQRLFDIFSEVARSSAKPAPASPSMNIAGRWDVDISFVVGSSKHAFYLETGGARVTGFHMGLKLKGELRGKLSGNRVLLRSSLPVEGTSLPYTFKGTVEGDRMSGEVDLDEYGKARFQARRRQG